jgi:hypothetical protein
MKKTYLTLKLTKSLLFPPSMALPSPAYQQLS